MNKTTENYLKALQEYNAPSVKPIVWRLVYDVESGKVIDLIITETDQPHIIISKEEADTYPHQDPRVRIVDGKITRLIKKLHTQEQPNKLAVKQSDFGNIATDDYNMLIINKLGKNRWTYE